jgi:hypothetical protein
VPVSLKNAIKIRCFDRNNIISFMLTLLYRAAKSQGLKAVITRPVFQALGLYCALRRRGKLRHYVVTPTENVLYIMDRHVIKYPLSATSAEALACAGAMYTALKSTALASLIPYQQRAYKCFIIIDRLYPIAPDAYDIADILKRLRGVNTGQENTTMQALFDAAYKKEPALQRLASIIPKDAIIDQGFMHGDLTPKNIMRTDKGQIALIDLDRCTWQGIPQYDQMHYAIERRAKENAQYKRYYDTLEELIDEAQSEDVLRGYLFYFLCRLNLERKNKAAFCTQERQKIEKIITLFVRAL